jgi:hypothetical protein
VIVMRRLAVLLLVACGVAAAPADAATKRSVPFTSCTSLVHYAQNRAIQTYGTQVLPPSRVAVMGAPVASRPFPADGGVAQPVAAAPGAEAQRDFSQTNVQEAGVDEPDLVKTDGKRVVAVVDNVLRVVTLDGGPKLAGSLKLDGYGHELLLAGDKALVLAQDDAVTVQPARAATVPVVYNPNSIPRSRIIEVSLADPSAPKVLRTQSLDGWFVSARLTGDTARVIVSSPPRPVQPEEQPADEAGIRAAIRHSKRKTWVPTALLKNRITGKFSAGPVVRCTRVRRPTTFAGLGTLTVLTIDVSKGLPAVDSDAVMTDGQTVYASTKRLVVATERWVDPSTPEADVPSGRGTTLHLFDAGTEPETHALGSTTVPGYLLNQFSLSEADGVLRVATTTDPVWIADAPAGQSESQVTTFAMRDGKLTQIGHVGGLGKGERIYAVRFLGDLGYVVTFRRIDPLFVVDVSDPAKPRVRGELKVPGYSGYLHPVAEGLLLGIGQDADENGRTTGAQVSLFDVSDPDKPTQLQRLSLGQYSWTPVESEHRAFLYWGPTALAMFPLSAYGGEGSTPFEGAIGVRVKREGLSEVGRIAHPSGAQVTRLVVVGDRVLSLSSQGLGLSALDTLAGSGFVTF